MKRNEKEKKKKRRVRWIDVKHFSKGMRGRLCLTCDPLMYFALPLVRYHDVIFNDNTYSCNPFRFPLNVHCWR